MAAIAAVASHRLLLTANQGDPDDREEQRDAEDDHSIHFESSHRKYRSRN
jgi:hypothetical protein